jgi:hypothetical protein
VILLENSLQASNRVYCNNLHPVAVVLPEVAPCRFSSDSSLPSPRTLPASPVPPSPTGIPTSGSATNSTPYDKNMIQLEEEPEIPAFARCSVGIGRWFWVAWDTWGAARCGEPARACGYEATAHAAEKKAIESVGPRARPLPPKWASGYKRRGAVGTHPGGTEKGGRGAAKEARVDRTAKGWCNPAKLEFLYCAYEGDQHDSPGCVVVVKHRIVKKTARTIYVDREPFREDQWERRCEEGREPSGYERETRTMIIDRDILKREGRYRHRRSHRAMFFYATEEDGIRDVAAALESLHAWCATLGVKFPCSVEVVKAAYRRLAKESHPDAGGDPTSFRVVEQAYRDALAYLDPSIAPP